MEEERRTLHRLGVLVHDREAEKAEMQETFHRINRESPPPCPLSRP